MRNLPSAKVMQTFETAARLGSFTLAAKELFLTQSAISRQIKGLEDALEFEVFIRDNNRLILTERGQIFYEVVSRALGEMSETVNQLRKTEELRRLLLVTPPTFAARWLAPRLPEFRKVCTAPLSLTNHTNLSYSPMGDYDCQVAFGGDEMVSMGGGLLFQEAIVPACTPELKERILQDGNFDGIPLLHTLTENNCRLPYWEIWMDRCENTPISPSSVDIATGFEFCTQNQTIYAAESGLGIAMVDINTASFILKSGQLVTLGSPVNTIYGYWIFPSTSRLADDEASKLLYDWIREQAKQSLREAEMLI